MAEEALKLLTKQGETHFLVIDESTDTSLKIVVPANDMQADKMQVNTWVDTKGNKRIRITGNNIVTRPEGDTDMVELMFEKRLDEQTDLTDVKATWEIVDNRPSVVISAQIGRPEKTGSAKVPKYKTKNSRKTSAKPKKKTNKKRNKKSTKVAQNQSE